MNKEEKKEIKTSRDLLERFFTRVEENENYEVYE